MYVFSFPFLYLSVILYQIVAREKTGSAASAPLSMSVSLNDVNDNAPKLPMIPPLTIQAGENKQSVTKVLNNFKDN
jgi:protocadherin-15